MMKVSLKMEKKKKKCTDGATYIRISLGPINEIGESVPAGS